MWIPKDEQDIINATSNGTLEETETFDAKKELPPKNVETAKDISAMANSGGGVIIYGIDEDESGRPTIPNPILLKGEREKIDQIIRTSVSEVPYYNILPVLSQADSTKGYLVVVIPPSERAPHMVIVKGEKRYYGRGETGNYILSEPEVTRLYERRNLIKKDFLPLLEQAIENAPLKENEKFSHLHILIKPVTQDDNLLNRATEAYDQKMNAEFYASKISEPLSNADFLEEDYQIISKWEVTYKTLLNDLIKNVPRYNEIVKTEYSPDFRIPNEWIRQTDGFLGRLCFLVVK
jgi:predicted HTH transcriptional regulator